MDPRERAEKANSTLSHLVKSRVDLEHRLAAARQQHHARYSGSGLYMSGSCSRTNLSKMWASHDEGEKIDRTFAKELAELTLLISAAEKEKKEADEALLSTG